MKNYLDYKRENGEPIEGLTEEYLRTGKFNHFKALSASVFKGEKGETIDNIGFYLATSGTAGSVLTPLLLGLEGVLTGKADANPLWLHAEYASFALALIGLGLHKVADKINGQHKGYYTPVDLSI